MKLLFTSLLFTFIFFQALGQRDLIIGIDGCRADVAALNIETGGELNIELGAHLKVKEE